MIKLIYVWIGEKIPNWVEIAMDINCKSSQIEIILLKNEKTKYNGKVKYLNIENFYNISEEKKNIKVNKTDKYRDNFLYKTKERFLVLQNYMVHYKIESIFHAEFDNLIFNINGLNTKLDSIGKGIFCPRDSKNRGIASLIYINDINALKTLCNYFNISNTSDMDNLGNLLENNKDKFFSLPTEKKFDLNINRELNFISSDRTDGIFDAAGIGQYLFGVDPRNIIGPLKNGFQNENAYELICDIKYQIDFKTNTANIKLKSKKENLYNIHVHSKIFDKISSEIYVENIVKRINEKKYTYIKLNLINSFKRIIEKITYKLLN